MPARQSTPNPRKKKSTPESPPPSEEETLADETAADAGPEATDAEVPDPPAMQEEEKAHEEAGDESGEESTFPAADLSRLAPRQSLADSFEQNPLAAMRTGLPEGIARHDLEDGIRVREALRSVIEQGDSVNDAAKDWHVAPSSITAWRARYRELLDEEERGPLFEVARGPQDHDLTHIPDAAKEIFTENWNRLVIESEATAADFVQSPRQIFLQTSPITSWLYQEGELDRGLLYGSLCGLIALGVITSFFLAEHAPPAVIAPPEPAPRDDLVIDQAAVVAQSFWQSANWEERLKFIRQPETVRGMVEAYYKDHPDAPINDATLSLAMPTRHLVNLSFEIPSLDRSHFLCVVMVKGKFLVDWESSSIYQEAKIAELRAKRSPEPSRIAVTITRLEENNYFNYAFSNADEWVCYQLGYPGLNLNLFGYAKKDSSESIAIDALLGIVHQQAVVLEVRFPPAAPVDNQVEILKLLREEWVPYDIE